MTGLVSVTPSEGEEEEEEASKKEGHLPLKVNSNGVNKGLSLPKPDSHESTSEESVAP